MPSEAERSDLQIVISEAQCAKQSGNMWLVNQHMTTLYELLHPVITNTIKYAIKMPPLNPQEIEDAATEVWISIHNNLENYSPEKASVETWACMIAKRKAIDAARRRGKARSRLMSLDKEDGETGNESGGGSMYKVIADTKNTDPSKQFIENFHEEQERQAVIRVLHRMKANNERLLGEWWDYVQKQPELTHEAIAQKLRQQGVENATRSMVEKRFRRLRETFLRLLKEDLGEDLNIP